MKISTYELAESKATEYAKKIKSSEAIVAKEDFIAGYLEARTDETVELLKLRECIRVLYDNLLYKGDFKSVQLISKYLKELGLKFE